MHGETPFRILIVEDEPGLREALQLDLGRRGYHIATSGSGIEAIDRFATNRFDLVLTDINLPDASGLDLVDRFRKSEHPVDVIMMTGYHDQSFALEAMRHGAYDFFIKPVCFDKLRLTIERVREKQSLEASRAQLQLLKREQQLAYETALALSHAAEERDRGNRGHGRRVACYSEWMARRLCFTAEKREILRTAALLHDIGKIGIDDAILNKPSRLTPPEMKQMQYHSEIGAYILAPISTFKEVAPIVRSHHEHYDGTGYPDGLAGEDIPIDARILCIADYYDAITSKRPYRAPDSLEKAVEILRGERGKTLDPTLTDIFIDILNERRVRSEAEVEA
jgi:putative two-component system response regulator